MIRFSFAFLIFFFSKRRTRLKKTRETVLIACQNVEQEKERRKPRRE